MNGRLVALLIGVLLETHNASAADAPKLLPFQGRLTDQTGNAISNGPRLVQFKIFDVPTGGSPVWAGELHRTTINGGLVNVLLGTKTPLLNLIFDRQLYLEITVDVSGPNGTNDNAITAADPPMLPRQVILPTLFAQESRNSSKLVGYDWSDILANGATNPRTGKIDGAKIADSTVTGQQIGQGSIEIGNLGASVASEFSAFRADLEEISATATNIELSVAKLSGDIASLSNAYFSLQLELQAARRDVTNAWVLYGTNMLFLSSLSTNSTEVAQWTYAMIWNNTFLKVLPIKKSASDLPTLISEQTGLSDGTIGYYSFATNFPNIYNVQFVGLNGAVLSQGPLNAEDPIRLYRRRR